MSKLKYQMSKLLALKHLALVWHLDFDIWIYAQTCCYRWSYRKWEK